MQVSDEAGWTHVVKSRTSRSSKAESLGYQFFATVESTNSETTEVLHKRLECYTREWRESSDARALAKIFHQIFEFEPSLTVRKIVCIALGSPCGGHISTWKQLGCLIELGKSLFPNAKVILQDPMFSKGDWTFFQELGMSVVDSPSAFEQIDGRTFLFAPHCEHEQFCEALSGRERPGLCITNDAQQYVRNYNIRRGAGAHQDSENIRIALEIEKTMRKREFPGNEKPEWYSTVVYALRSDEE